MIWASRSCSSFLFNWSRRVTTYRPQIRIHPSAHCACSLRRCSGLAGQADSRVPGFKGYCSRLIQRCEIFSVMPNSDPASRFLSARSPSTTLPSISSGLAGSLPSTLLPSASLRTGRTGDRRRQYPADPTSLSAVTDRPGRILYSMPCIPELEPTDQDFRRNSPA